MRIPVYRTVEQVWQFASPIRPGIAEPRYPTRRASWLLMLEAERVSFDPIPGLDRINGHFRTYRPEGLPVPLYVPIGSRLVDRDGLRLLACCLAPEGACASWLLGIARAGVSPHVRLAAPTRDVTAPESSPPEEESEDNVDVVGSPVTTPETPPDPDMSAAIDRAVRAVASGSYDGRPAPVPAAIPGWVRVGSGFYRDSGPLAYPPLLAGATRHESDPEPPSPPPAEEGPAPRRSGKVRRREETLTLF